MKKHPQHYRHGDWKKGLLILIICGRNVPDTTVSRQTTGRVPTSPNVCFCTTCEKRCMCRLSSSWVTTTLGTRVGSGGRDRWWNTRAIHSRWRLCWISDAIRSTSSAFCRYCASASRMWGGLWARRLDRSGPSVTVVTSCCVFLSLWFCYWVELLMNCQNSSTYNLTKFVTQTLLARSNANSKLTFFYVLRLCLIFINWLFVMHSRSGLE